MAKKKMGRIVRGKYKPSKEQYKKYYDKHHAPGKPHAEGRSARNKARQQAIKEGRASVGDGTEVDHVDRNPKNNSRKNTRVVSRKFNRSRSKKK